MQAFLEEGKPHCGGQRGIGEGENALGRGFRPEAECRAEAVQRCVGGAHVELHGAAEEELRVQPAERQIGVGDGGFGAAAAIGDGAGAGAGAARPHGQPPAGLHGGDGAAAGADGAHFHHGQADRQAVDLALGDDGDAAILHH